MLLLTRVLPKKTTIYGTAIELSIHYHALIEIMGVASSTQYYSVPANTLSVFVDILKVNPDIIIFISSIDSALSN